MRHHSDANFLRGDSRLDNSGYLAGYVVECSLKALIVSQRRLGQREGWTNLCHSCGDFLDTRLGKPQRWTDRCHRCASHAGRKRLLSSGLRQTRLTQPGTFSATGVDGWTSHGGTLVASGAA